MGAVRKISDKEVLSKVADDLIVLLADEPFYVYVLTQMKKVVDTQVPVAGVSVIEGKITLYINPKGYLRYTKPERLFILKHEVLHVIFIHYLRRNGRDPHLWNVAADIAINQLIETEFCQAPVDCLKPEHYDLPLKESAEAYYNILLKKPGKIQIPLDLLESILGRALSECPDCNGTGQQNENTENENGQGDNQGQGEGGSGSGHSHGDGQGQPCPSCGGSGKNQNQSDSKAPDFAGLHPKWDLSSDVGEQLAESMVRSIIKEAHKKARGNVPGAIKQVIEDFLDATVPWKQIFRQFIAKARSTSKYSTWRKQNRRLGDEIMGYKKDNKLLLAVAVDTSASVSDEQLQAFLSEIRRMVLIGANVIIMECDTNLADEPKKFTRSMANNASFEFHGRGGTDFRPVFDYLSGKPIKVKGVSTTINKKLFPRDPDAVIFLTDGYGPAPSEKFRVPTLWCITNNGRKPVEWGKELKLVV